MGEQRNLTEENVEEMTTLLEKMKETNQDLEYRFFKQKPSKCCGARVIFNNATGDYCCAECRNPVEPKEQEEQPSNKKIFEKLESLEMKLSLIFGRHVLIDGQFREIE